MILVTAPTRLAEPGGGHEPTLARKSVQFMPTGRRRNLSVTDDGLALPQRLRVWQVVADELLCGEICPLCLEGNGMNEAFGTWVYSSAFWYCLWIYNEYADAGWTRMALGRGATL